MTCPHCGAAVTTGARFCAACGRSLDTSGAGPTVSASDLPTQLGPSEQPTQLSPSDQPTRLSPSTSAAPTSGGAGWLTSSGSISHGRFAPGVVLEGRYRIIGLLGRGGMGEVYRADDLRLGQPVALKFLPDAVAKDAHRLEQFHNEVRAARQVSHPNICRVYDIGELSDPGSGHRHLFLTMELVDGEDLAASLRRIGRFPEDKALEIARQLCAGLAAAHDRGVLHRDLKPANVMLDAAGKVRLMDFGLAAVGGDAGVHAGTPGYMAPEQMQGRAATPQSDIYALGLVMYELFTGRRAYSATTLQEFAEQQRRGAFTAPSTIVSNLNPAIERAITRCLDPDPARRPSSALLVSASLPGGDPLAAALAAGETPSPEMVAASGKGIGLGRIFAAALLVFVVVGLAASYVMGLRVSVLQRLKPDLPPDVLAERARGALRTLGYDGRPYDEAYDFYWDSEVIKHADERDAKTGQPKPFPLSQPSPMGFWYRGSREPLYAGEFHHDLLTPGIVTENDPPPIQSGMVSVRLDHQGRLTAFEIIPPQIDETPVSSAAVDWAPLLTLAGLDQSQLTATAPTWNWLSSPDTRAAWTGKWPGTGDDLRVEAAARAGKPVAFQLVGPWTKPSRTAEATTTAELFIVGFLVMMVLAIIVGSALLARKNLRDGRGDRTSAFRLACVFFAMLWAVWLCQTHFTASISMVGNFLIATCTTVAYGVLLWAIYLALEPFVRRHWPQTLVSWTTLVSGRVRDPIVGRDVLIGVAIGVAIAVIVQYSGSVEGTGMTGLEMLLGGRRSANVVLSTMAYGARSGLLIFYLLFLLRVLLRNQWVAAAVLTLLFATLDMLDDARPVQAFLSTSLYFALLAGAVLRWGLTALVVALSMGSLILNTPITTDRSAWFIMGTVICIVIPLALAVWGFVVSAPGQRVKRAGMFDA